jgi:hypothetical protein
MQRDIPAPEGQVAYSVDGGKQKAVELRDRTHSERASQWDVDLQMDSGTTGSARTGIQPA